MDELKDVSLGAGLPGIPERLLLAHATGEVLFICGAGISRSAGLPNFQELVREVYRELDPAVYRTLSKIDSGERRNMSSDGARLTDRQAAEVKRYEADKFDVVLGMLERRLDSRTREDSRVRNRVTQILRSPAKHGQGEAAARTEQAEQKDVFGAAGKPAPSSVHRSLIRLADRGGPTTIMTTNFDLLLEEAARRLGANVETYALGSIPRPTRRTEFAGVFHIHGALSRDPVRYTDLVLTDQDFGEFYLRRRIVPDLIYDAARLYHLVLVGYSANDPPMRYLLDAVAADETRFDDLKKRYIFVGSDEADPVELADWRARGIVPIPYAVRNDDHSALRDVLARWADLSAINGKEGVIDDEVRRIVKTDRAASPQIDQGLFDHLYRRGNRRERVRMAKLASKAGAGPGWLDAMMSVGREPPRVRRR